MPEIIPPPPTTPDERPTEVDSSLAGIEEQLAQAKPLARLKKWGAVLGTVAGIFSALGGIWKTFDTINDLHDTILANKAAVGRMDQENREAHREMQAQMRATIEAVREARAQDQQVVTNLRIAIAALQAAQGVREGRLAYNPSALPGVAPGDPLAGLALADAPPEPPRTARARRAMAEAAEEDAQRALRRAAETEGDRREDPLEALLAD